MTDNTMTYSMTHFVAGVGLGVALGMLFAPKAGKETRASLRSQAQAGANYVQKCGEELGTAATEIVHKGKDMVQKQTESISKAMEAGKQAYSDALEPTVPDGGLHV